MGAIRSVEQTRDVDFEAGVDSKFHILYGEDLAKPLPPKPWLCKSLGIAPGPPTILGGAGFGGKTMAAQALAMAVATGTKLWGEFAVRRGEVIHLDWEQDELTVRRYQRMARSMRIDLASLRQMLGASLTPNASLDDEGTERALAWICRGKALCIIDSFRGAFRRAQENDSSVYDHLAMLKRVSIATGCVILLIAHARKMGDDKDIRSSLRGSAAMFDASATVYMLDGQRGKPTRVTNTKERNTGELKDDFGLRIVDEAGPRIDPEDGADDIDLKWGLRVEYVSGPDLQVAYEVDDRADNSIAINEQRIVTVGCRIRDILLTSAHGMTLDTLRGMLRSTAGNSDIAAALPIAIQAGGIRSEGRGKDTLYFAVPDDGRQPGDD